MKAALISLFKQDFIGKKRWENSWEYICTYLAIYIGGPGRLLNISCQKVTINFIAVHSFCYWSHILQYSWCELMMTLDSRMETVETSGKGNIVHSTELSHNPTTQCVFWVPQFYIPRNKDRDNVLWFKAQCVSLYILVRYNWYWKNPMNHTVYLHMFVLVSNSFFHFPPKDTKNTK